MSRSLCILRVTRVSSFAMLYLSDAVIDNSSYGFTISIQ